MSIRISLVTISFNQAEYLARTIESVLSQGYGNLQYIVVDPGSTDGSRQIIEEYSDRIDHVIFEPDQGAADGLNHGFEVANGDVFGYLNSDDVLLPGSLQKVAQLFAEHADYDVISGHCKVIDAKDCELRESYSDSFRPKAVLYRAANLMQPSTFFRRSVFEETKGFNTDNRLDWDTELFLDMHKNGAKFMRCNEMISGYRLHAAAVTAGDRTSLVLGEKWRRLFQERMLRHWAWFDNPIRWGYLVLKYLREPRWLRERLLRGYVSGRSE